MFHVILSCKLKLSSHISTLFPAEKALNKTPLFHFNTALCSLVIPQCSEIFMSHKCVVSLLPEGSESQLAQMMKHQCNDLILEHLFPLKAKQVL